ncbi:uncharacterized protein [Parasteatoda tepidariorum]|uniref:uncharacterized protein n=1 Tax=Parasteatoda tepidariorum TaxID=114398 RepID=UPI00077FE46F|nr:uncharacterized protein LOC107456221 [Parasteatoda tepidariorum]
MYINFMHLLLRSFLFNRTSTINTMKGLALALCLALFSQVVVCEECEYTMEKMCSLLAPTATYNVRGCWYTCRIKAEFEVFSGTFLDSQPCKSIVGNNDGVCFHGACYPNNE